MKAVLQQPVNTVSFNYSAGKKNQPLKSGKEAEEPEGKINASSPSFNFGDIPLYQPPAYLQTKLTINTPGDVYEQQADAMAEKVMRMSDGEALQTKSSAQGIQRKCAKCEEEEDDKKLQRKEANNAAPAASQAVHQTLQSTGKPLDKTTRSFMEQRFGVDFGNVRIHDDATAHQSAKDINALAYTHGNSIAFSAGKYNTNSIEGKKLLAHELTHVVQQNKSISKKQIQKKTDPSSTSSADPVVITKPAKKNPAKNGKIHLEFIADVELPPAQVGVPNHTLMIWAIQKLFNIEEMEAAGVVSEGGFNWITTNSRTKNYLPGDKVAFTLPVSSISNWIAILSRRGLVDPGVADLFEEMMKLQQTLSDRDYSFFIEWAKTKGAVVTDITSFDSLTPESFEKIKQLYAEFKRDKYSILAQRGVLAKFFLTEDVTRDMQLEELKDRLYGKELKDVSAEDRKLALTLFKDKALSYAFVALEESKIISKEEIDKYTANPDLLDEIAEIITGYTASFAANIEKKLIEFGKFREELFSILSVAPTVLMTPPQTSLFWKIQGFWSRYRYGGNNDIVSILKAEPNPQEIINLFSANDILENTLSETLTWALHQYGYATSKEHLRDIYLPETINSPLFSAFRTLLPLKNAAYEWDEMLKAFLQIIYKTYPAITESSIKEEKQMNDLSTEAIAKNHRILKDVSVDFKEMALLKGKNEVKARIVEMLAEKPRKADKTQARLKGDSMLLWEFQPLLYHVLRQENLDVSHPIYKIVDQRIKEAADKSFWESLALGALGLVLGLAGIFTGGTTTVIGVGLLAGAATVSLIDFAREYEQYTIQSEAHASAISVPFADDPSAIGVILSLAGLVLDVGDVLKVFGKSAKLVAEAAGTAADATQASLKAISQTKNIDDYANRLFELLESTKKIKPGITRDMFVKTIKESWGESRELTQSWGKYKELIETLPADIKDVVKAVDFAAMPVEIRSSIFKIYDYSKEAFNKVIQALAGSVDKLRLLGYQIFTNKSLGEAYGQLAQLLGTKEYDRVVNYFTSIGHNSADLMPELLHLMNRGDVFSKSKLAVQVLTNRQLQQLTLSFHTNPGHLLILWDEFVKTGKAGGDFVKYIDESTVFSQNLKLAESSQPVAKLTTAPTGRGVLTDINGKPPGIKALEGISEDIDNFVKYADDPANINAVTDAKYTADYDAEIFTDNHTFRRNKQTGRWCRFSDEVCNIDTPAALNSKVDEALGNPDKIIPGSAEDITTKISAADIPESTTPAEWTVHKKQRWQEYEQRMKNNPKKWSQKRWSNVYEENMVRAKKANEAVNAFKAAAPEGSWIRTAEREVLIEIEGVVRRVDLMDTQSIPAALRKDGIYHLEDLEKAGIKPKVVEHKTGDIYNRQEIQWEIARDEILVKEKGWSIEWVFEGTASAPLRKELEKAQIPYRIIPKP